MSASVTTMPVEVPHLINERPGLEKDEKPFVMRDEEKATLDALREISLRLASGKPYWAPVTNARSVLDLGSGTGQWMRDFVEATSPEQIVGLDLASPPKDLEFPNNCRFVVGDLEKPWPLTEQFDFIHAGLLMGCLMDWPAFFKRAYEQLKPGSWFEMFDIGFAPGSDDGSFLPTSAQYQWNQLLIDASKQTGRSLTVTSQYRDWIVDAGFQNVKEIVYKVPQNPWPTNDQAQKELGEISLPMHQFGHERLGLDFLVPEMGMKEQEVLSRLKDVHREMADRDIHTWWPFHVVYGQKPE